MAEERSERRIKVVAAMPGLDCHDRGLIYLTSLFRNSGMEVIYLGKFNTPENIVKTAVDEDVDAIALSYLNDHLYMMFYPKIMELLKENNAVDICVVVGGRIAEEDVPELEKLGITGFFEQGISDKTIVTHIVERVNSERWELHA